MKLPHLRSEQIKTQPDQTSALINKIIDRVNDPNLGGGGGGGTSDFNELTNRPSYAGTTMTGSTNIPAVPTKTSQLNNDSGFVNTTDLTNAISNHNTSGTAHSDIRNSITSLSNSVTAIQNVIPTAATANNKLTDKNYVDDSINSVTAYYITKNAAGDAFATKAELNSATVFYSGGVVRIPTRNDYCIVVADESQRDPITGEDPTTRYIYNNGWEFQYIVNKTALTADQLAALNSGVTAADVTKLSGIEAGAEVNVQADWTEADNTSDAYIKNKPTIGNATLTVTQNGTSVGTFTANATSDVTLALTDTLYNDFTGATNITAGAHGLVIAPAAGDQLKALYGDGTWKLAHMTIAAYGKTTYAEILAAYKANNIIYCRASSNSNPGTGNQLRMAFLAYVNNETTPTEFEFQYYRSVATHTDAQQGDQVYVYKINSAGTWSVTVRSAFTKVAAGTNMTSSYSSGTITLNATDTTYSPFVGATSSVAGSAGLVPTPTTSDPDKFLKGDGTWDTPTDTTYSAGTNIQISAGNVISATDTTYSDFTGATSGTAGTSGLVPGPLAGDQDKYLKGDGTWGTISSTDTVYYINNPLEDLTTFSIYTDNTLTTTVSAQTLHTAFTSGRVILRADVNGYKNSAYELVDALYDVDDSLYDFFLIQRTTEYTFGGSANTTSFTMNTKNLQEGLTAGSNIQINGTTISATDTTYSAFTGASSGTAGTSGLVPAPAAGDNTKFLSGDGTWKTASAGGTRTEFRWGSSPDHTMKDTTDTNTVTGQDVYDACELGQVIITSMNPKPVHDDEVVSYQYYQSTYRFVVTYKDYSDSKHDMREYVYESGSWSSNVITLQSELSNATTTTDGTMSAADKTNLDNLVTDDYLHDKFIAKGGTLIEDNSDLEDTDFLDLGMYYCPRNANVATIINCPVANAFTMRVYSPNDNFVRDTMTGTWVYRVREITTIIGQKWIQYVYSGDTPGSFTFRDWNRILTTGDGSFADKVDIASENIDNYSGTLAAKVQSIYPAGYHRWYTTINGSTANITDKPTTINMGFVLEAFLERDYNSTDWAYKVVCYTSYDDNQNYVGYVRNNTSSITWQKLLHSGSTIPESMLLHTNYYDRLAAIGGTDIPSNADLNTITYLSIGMYACETNAKAASLSNCPTSSAFTMRVYLSHSTSPRDINNEQWVYLVREITDLQGRKWNQNASSGTTPGVFTYGTWKQVIDERRVLSATAVRDAGWNADKDYIPDMSMFAYWNGAYSGTSSNLQYFKNGSVTFSNLKTGSSGDYWTKAAGINASGVTEVGKYIDFHDTATSANNFDVRLYSNGANKNTVALPNSTGTLALTSDCRYVAGTTYDMGSGVTLMGCTQGSTNKVTWTLPLNKSTDGLTVSSVNLSGTQTNYYGHTIPGHVGFRPVVGAASNVTIRGGCISFTTTLNTTVTTYHEALGYFGGKIDVVFANA